MWQTSPRDVCSLSCWAQTGLRILLNTALQMKLIIILFQPIISIQNLPNPQVMLNKSVLTWIRSLSWLPLARAHEHLTVLNEGSLLLHPLLCQSSFCPSSDKCWQQFVSGECPQTFKWKLHICGHPKIGDLISVMCWYLSNNQLFKKSSNC